MAIHRRLPNGRLHPGTGFGLLHSCRCGNPAGGTHIGIEGFHSPFTADDAVFCRVAGGDAADDLAGKAALLADRAFVHLLTQPAEEPAFGTAAFFGQVARHTGSCLAADHPGETAGKGAGSTHRGSASGLAAAHDIRAALFESAKSAGGDHRFAQHAAAGMPDRDAEAGHKAVDLLADLEKGNGAEEPDEQIAAVAGAHGVGDELAEHIGEQLEAPGVHDKQEDLPAQHPAPALEDIARALGAAQGKGYRRCKDQDAQQNVPFRRLKEQLDIVPRQDDQQNQRDEQHRAADRPADDHSDDAHEAGKLDGR